MGEARASAVAAHAAARSADEGAARAAARAAGQAAGTPQMTGHAPHAAAYAAKAVTYASAGSAAAVAEEREWRYQRLPEHLRPVAFPAPRGLRPLASCPSIPLLCSEGAFSEVLMQESCIAPVPNAAF